LLGIIIFDTANMPTEEMPKYTTQTYCFSNVCECLVYLLMQVSFAIPVLYERYVKQWDTINNPTINPFWKRGEIQGITYMQ